MSGRGRPRKARDENPGASRAKSPRGTRKKSGPSNEEQVKDKKTTDAKTSCLSKLQESQKICARKPPKDNPSVALQTPKPPKSDEKKAALRSSETRHNSTEKIPANFQDAPAKVQKNQRSESAKTSNAKVNNPPKVQESRVARAKTSPSDADCTEETQGPTPLNTSEKKRNPNSSATRGSSVDDNLSKVLQNILEKLKVKKSQRSESAKCVNEIQNKIIEYLKRHLDWCRDISVLKTGSYYENLKICQPDEFDVMLTVHVQRVELQPFSKDGAFYSVKTKRNPQRHPLDKFLNEDKTIMASEMLKEFREKIKEAVEELPSVTLERKKMGCPAVTLLVDEKDISIDFVLGLEVNSSWPTATQDGFKIENWLGKKERMEQRWKPLYLVPKYEGRGTAEQDGIMAKNTWRISFSHVEKSILKKHGNTKTCCEKVHKCCRKQCLKLLKYLLQRLKEEHPNEADKLCSYHAKTTLLHACAARVTDGEWADNELSQCFKQLLKDFEENLRACNLPNFFIPSQNLFDGLNKKTGKFLADYIENQRNNGFPLLC